MIPSKWALTVESDILWVNMKARYSVSQQGNLSQMHSSLWPPNKSQIRRQWGRVGGGGGGYVIAAVHKSKPPTFLKDKLLRLLCFLQYSKCSRPQNEQAITTPTPDSFSFSCFHSLPLSLAPPYLCVVYTLKWVLLSNTPLFFLS